ncbi:hypothetical protein KHA80_13210 [Anaerobacillus sp. HL2]|nr:hypothetical protein KHA80_13210 [Anaerobacillus sp. HL2]
MELQPFNKTQALKMITNSTSVKKKSKNKGKISSSVLDNETWESHREFAENPLLLTIMLMTFEEEFTDTV